MNNATGKPELLIVTSTYPRWAADTEPAFVHQLALRLTDRFDVVVMTSRAPGARPLEVMDGVQVHRYAYAPSPWETLVHGGGLMGNLRATPWKLLLLPTYLTCWIWQVAMLRRKYRFDVVHAHWFVPGAIVAALAMRGTPMCVTAHGTDVLGLKDGLWRWLRQFIAIRSAAITVVGKRLQDALESEGIAPTMLLPMGVDLSGLFVPMTRKHGAPSSRLLFVGRLVEAKRPDVVMRVFAKALEVHANLDLDMVGDGPERCRLEALADELGIRSHVTFHGRKNQAEIAVMYRLAMALIIASGGDDAPEGLGLVAIEALGSGCPVVSAPNVALQAVLPEAAPIRYASDSSSDALTEALLGRLAEPDCNVSDTESPWRDQLVQQFGWEAVAEEYGRLLESLIVSKDGLQ